MLVSFYQLKTQLSHGSVWSSIQLCTKYLQNPKLSTKYNQNCDFSPGDVPKPKINTSLTEQEERANANSMVILTAVLTELKSQFWNWRIRIQTRQYRWPIWKKSLFSCSFGKQHIIVIQNIAFNTTQMEEAEKLIMSPWNVSPAKNQRLKTWRIGAEGKTSNRLASRRTQREGGHL